MYVFNPIYITLSISFLSRSVSQLLCLIIFLILPHSSSQTQKLGVRELSASPEMAAWPKLPSTSGQACPG